MSENQKRIALVFHHPPVPIGTGGHHRSYQIVHDLTSAFPSAEQVIFHPWQDQPVTFPEKRGYSWSSYRTEFALRFRFLSQFIRKWASPYRLLGILFDQYSDQNHYLPFDFKEYQKFLDQNTTVDLCLVDHPVFLEVVRMNHKHNIPTILCTQNLESFDRYAISTERQGNALPFLMGFQQELKFYAACDERLSISKAETWLLNGLDLPTQYYPYLPVGEIRQNLLAVREKRKNRPVDRSLFLVLGTSTHSPSGHGFRWLLKNIQTQGLPADVRIIFVGKGTLNFREEFGNLPGVEFKGWLENDELTEMMVSTTTVLVPHLTGFGSQTRIPEMACAGIPTLVSAHALTSMNPPPGVTPIPNVWEAWHTAILQSAQDSSHLVDWNDYLDWEKQQPKPMAKLAEKYLGLSMNG